MTSLICALMDHAGEYVLIGTVAQLQSARSVIGLVHKGKLRDPRCIWVDPDGNASELPELEASLWARLRNMRPLARKKVGGGEAEAEVREIHRDFGPPAADRGMVGPTGGDLPDWLEITPHLLADLQRRGFEPFDRGDGRLCELLGVKLDPADLR